jgi:mRNA interferase MazF
MKQNDNWLINLDPTMGAEIKKTRPAIVVNDNALGKLLLKIIVPLTDWKDHYKIAPWMVKVDPSQQNGLSKISSIDCFQIRSVSENRFLTKLGEIDKMTQEKIKFALTKVLSIHL